MARVTLLLVPLALFLSGCTSLDKRVSRERLTSEQKEMADYAIGDHGVLWSTLEVQPPQLDRLTPKRVSSLIGRWSGETRNDVFPPKPFNLKIRNDGTWTLIWGGRSEGGEWIFCTDRVELWQPKLEDLRLVVGSVSNVWQFITLDTTGGIAPMKRDK